MSTPHLAALLEFVGLLAQSADPGGRALYLARCAMCHGSDGRGGDQAPNLRRSRIVLAGREEALFRIVKYGIPGAGMPAQKIPDEEIREVGAYVIAMVRPPAAAAVTGDRVAGEKTYLEAGCPQCHMIGGKGGVLGPDLSGVGAHLGADAIREAVLDPGAKVANGFRLVTVVTGVGETVAGTLKNEDNFSIQIMRPDGEYVLLAKADAKSIAYEQRSAMPPAYGMKLTAIGLQDLIAYLSAQRNSSNAAEVWVVKPH